MPLDKLSEVSGIPQSEVKQIWEQVQANHRTLEACVRPHDFQPLGERPLFDRFKCSRCGGEVDGINARWYTDGLRDASK